MDRILLVDDDIDVLSVVKMMLSEKGFQVHAISDWKDIEGSIKMFYPDLILLDVHLGDADGRNICKQLKESENTRHIPVILFSAIYDLQNNLKECRAEAFLSKPFEPSRLIETIKSNLN